MRLLPRSKPVRAAPSLQFRYRTFRATTSCSVPVRRLGTLPLAGAPLAVLPCHRRDRFPRSTQEPGPRSRRLHAGRRPSSKQVPLGLIPEAPATSGFDATGYCFDTSTAVHLRSTPRPLPDRVSAPPFPTRSPPRLLNAAAVGGLKPPPARRLRRTFLHLLCSMAAWGAFAPLCAFVAHAGDNYFGRSRLLEWPPLPRRWRWREGGGGGSPKGDRSRPPPGSVHSTLLTSPRLACELWRPRPGSSARSVLRSPSDAPPGRSRPPRSCRRGRSDSTARRPGSK